MTTNISEHFTLEEFYTSETASKRKIDNSPSIGAIANLTKLAAVLEKVRDILGQPIHINSGFRCLALNLAIGGAKTSSHMTGCAADITSSKFGTPKEVMDAILASGIRFHRIILEPTWVHIDIPYEAANEGYDMMTLEAVFEPGKPVRYIPYQP